MQENGQGHKQQLQQKGAQIEEAPIKTLPQRQSEFSLQYAQFFEGLTDAEPQLDAIIQRLSQHSIKYAPSAPHQSPPALFIESKSTNSEIVILTIKWGKFTQLISVINFVGPNPILSQGDGRDNRRCIIYQRKQGDKEIVFKSQPFDSGNRCRNILSALKEVFIGKIASALEFGPICCHQTGFDVFLYENSIEFCMEKCIGFKERPFKRLNTDSLLSGLRLMHSLQIVHFDVKPENIMFSEGLGKLVTIDFNLSEVTNFTVGKKVPIPFRGTLNFCYPEMTQNFILTSNFNFVDPYYNDIHCLRETFLLISQQPVENRNQQFDERPNEKIEQWFLILRLKHLLYAEDWKKASVFFAMHLKQFAHSMKEIMKFMYELHPSEGLSSFYTTSIPACQKDALFMREFNHRMSEKWIMNIRPQYAKSEKEKEFGSRLLIDILEEGINYQIVDKRECREFLENEEKFLTERAVYFNVFLDYVSFHHNRYRVDARQRNEVAIICHQLIKKCALASNLQGTNNHFLLIQKQKSNAMDVALRFILRETISDLQSLKDTKIQNDAQRIVVLRQTVRKLLLFIFILDVGSLEENLSWFDQLISSFTDPKDKFAILFSIKHLNRCNQYRISGKNQDNNSRFTTNMRIKEFCFFRLSKQQKDISTALYSFMQMKAKRMYQLQNLKHL